jgi:hypothetical protein
LTVTPASVALCAVPYERCREAFRDERTDKMLYLGRSAPAPRALTLQSVEGLPPMNPDEVASDVR